MGVEEEGVEGERVGGDCVGSSSRILFSAGLGVSIVVGCEGDGGFVGEKSELKKFLFRAANWLALSYLEAGFW